MFFYLFIAALLLVLLWLTRVREDFLGSRERFLDMPTPFEFDPETPPDPKKLMGFLRGLLDKYDRPEVIDAIMQQSTMDPRELALMNLQGE